MNSNQTITCENTALIPCFLCGNGLEIRTSVRNKPYLICDWCGVQTFIRGQRGIKSFYEYKNSLKSGEIIMTGKNNLKITASINCLAELKAKLKQLEGYPTMLDLMLPQRKPELTVQVLHKAISQIENQLKEFLQ
jgi:hypothetical protein